jgi:hypothetical protein
VYRFQVKTTVGGIESDFVLKAAEFNMVSRPVFPSKVYTAQILAGFER